MEIKSPSPLKKMKILIAEDDEPSELFINLIVKPYGRVVLKTRTGEETVETCRNNPDIDLILMDIKMPGMNGHEATRKIREFNKDVIIIAQTAYALTGDRRRALAAGCNDYIAKPFRKSDLLQLIFNWFEKDFKPADLKGI